MTDELQKILDADPKIAIGLLKTAHCEITALRQELKEAREESARLQRRIDERHEREDEEAEAEYDRRDGYR